MTTLGDPRPLTNEELLDFEQTDRCRQSWYLKSLLLTIAAIREELFYELELVRAQLNESNRNLNWFENTYSTRALAPLRKPRAKYGVCPYCSKRGEMGIGDHRGCSECGKRWTRGSESGNSPPATTPIPTVVTNLAATLMAPAST